MAAHAAERDFAGEDQAAGDLVLGALDLVVVQIGLDLLQFLHRDVQRLLGALGVGGEGDVEAAAGVVRVEAEVGVLGDRVVDQRPVEAASRRSRR